MATADTTVGSTTGDVSPVVLAQEAAKNAGIFSFDYTVPTSPALELAGLPNSATTSSSSLKPFVLSLPGLLTTGSSSTSATTGSFDVSPAWAFGLGNAETKNAYAASDNYLGRLAFRTRIGVALNKGVAASSTSTTSKPSLAAAGISISIADSSDPLVASQPGDTPLSADILDGQVQSTWLSCLDSPTIASALTPISPLDDPALRPLTLQGAPLLMAQQAYQASTNSDIHGHFDMSVVAKVEGQMHSIAGLTPKGVGDADLGQRIKDDLQQISDWEQGLKSVNVTTSNQGAAKAIAQCKQEASNAAQHGAALDLGFGGVWQGDPGKFESMGHGAAAVWVAARAPIAPMVGVKEPCEPSSATKNGSTSELSCWTIGGAGRVQSDEQVTTGQKSIPMFNARILDAWIGLERTDSNSQFAASYGYLDQHATDSSMSPFTRSGGRWLVSGSYNLARISSTFDGMWLAASYGKATGTTDTLNDKTFMLTLNFTAPKGGLFQSSSG